MSEPREFRLVFTEPIKVYSGDGEYLLSAKMIGLTKGQLYSLAENVLRLVLKIQESESNG